MGFDHPQWEMWSSSKHGVRYLLKQNGTLPETHAGADLPDLPHAGRRPRGAHRLGLPAVRLPLPEDEQWKADQVTILQASACSIPRATRPRGSTW